MSLTKFGFIVTGAGLDPSLHTQQLSSPQFTMTTVGVERAEQGVDVAKQMVADGIELIELCGGFGPVWTGKIIEAIDGAVPVGSVGYGPEATDQMHALFS